MPANPTPEKRTQTLRTPSHRATPSPPPSSLCQKPSFAKVTPGRGVRDICAIVRIQLVIRRKRRPPEKRARAMGSPLFPAVLVALMVLETVDLRHSRYRFIFSGLFPPSTFQLVLFFIFAKSSVFDHQDPRSAVPVACLLACLHRSAHGLTMVDRVQGRS